MAWGSRIVGGVLVGAIGLLLAGCQAGTTANIGGPGLGPMMAAIEPEQASVARAQLPDPPAAPQPFTAATATKTPLPLPPPPSNLLPSGNPLLQASSKTIGAQQAADLIDASQVRIKVRAWVNGRPIFHDELMQIVAPAVQGMLKMPEPQRSEKIAEVFSTALEHLVDQEVMYQDAVTKLEKGNKKALDKLKELCEQDYQKSVKKMRDGGVPDEYIKAVSHVARRMLERSLISREYANNRIRSHVERQVTLEKIQEYYKDHLREFEAVDKVQWQDVFIAVGPKYPTPADAKRFAEDLIARCRTPEDFAKVLAYDEGDSKFRGGEGLGQRRGEIRPPELEAMLFELKEGQIGPVFELPTGVHIFRVVKREYAGQLPLNDQTQKAIRRKLEIQIATREIRQLVRELRSRSVICIIREGN
jgi:peptidyl-prolyl cis-trans isomerase SurA